MKKRLWTSVISVFFILGVIGNANASLIAINKDDFTPVASVITFSEKPLGTQNPVYDFGSYNVSFAGFFNGGLGHPATGSSLSLDTASPVSFITTDSSNPTSPVLSGTPRFNGPIAVLFSKDVAAVGLDGGYFNALEGTTIAAYDRNGGFLGSVKNQKFGMEFFGLGDTSGDAVIAGIQFYITGSEPAGYGVDNLTFAFDSDGYNPHPTPIPAAIFLFGTGIVSLAGLRRKKKNVI